MIDRIKPTKWQNVFIYTNIQSYESEREFTILEKYRLKQSSSFYSSLKL